MSAPPRTLTALEQNIVDARAAQMAARIAWARSPNRDTIDAEKLSTRNLNLLIDRLPRP